MQILNNFDKWNEKNKNNEIEKEIIILINGELKQRIFKYEFKFEGKYTIYYIQKYLLANMIYIFFDCDKIEEIDLSAFNTEKLIDMGHLFEYCISLKK